MAKPSPINLAMTVPAFPPLPPAAGETFPSTSSPPIAFTTAAPAAPVAPFPLFPFTNGVSPIQVYPVQLGQSFYVYVTGGSTDQRNAAAGLARTTGVTGRIYVKAIPSHLVLPFAAPSDSPLTGPNTPPAVFTCISQLFTPPVRGIYTVRVVVWDNASAVVAPGAVNPLAGGNRRFDATTIRSRHFRFTVQ
jgi:hypothetical protein